MRPIIPIVFAFSILGVAVPALAGTCTDTVPMGAIAPARPIWCEVLESGTGTHTEGSNSWSDNFDHGQSMARLNPAYVEGYLGNGEARHFQHNNHWMVDIESRGDGALIAAWMRPNRSFRTQADGSVVVEFEVAGPIAGTRDADTLSDSWPEFTISTAPNPPGVQSWGSAIRRNGTYLYEAFPGAWTFGCRMQQSKHPICALYNNGFDYAGSGDRVWEINQNGTDVTYEQGGGPGGLAPSSWLGCTSSDDPDTVCRNKFRWQLWPNRVLLHVNGQRFYEAGLIDTSLSNILNNNFYVYNGDFAYRMNPGRALRFHWDHLAVNPGNLTDSPPEGSVPVPTLAPSPSPSSTPVPSTPVPTQTPVPTVVPPTATLTPVPTPVPPTEVRCPGNSQRPGCRSEDFKRR
jgi:hypothetical protein